MIARTLGHERDAFRAVFRIHVVLAVILASAFALLSPLIARFENAPHITVPPLMSVVVLLYGTYAPVVGLLNGRGEFSRQAALDVTFAVLRTVGMVALGFLFVHRGWAGVTGATAGFIVAATCIVPLALRLALPLRTSPEVKDSENLPDRDGAPFRRDPEARTRPETPTTKLYLLQLWPLAAAQFCTNLVMQVDIMMLGHFLSPQAGSATAADEWVGVYRACQLFAFLPYQLLLSITQVLFPMVARAKAEGDSLRVRLYVERGARLAAIASGMMVSVLVGMPRAVLAFAYPAEVALRGADTLRILALGQGAYTMLAIATTVLSSLGRELVSFLLTLGALVTVLIACVGLTSRASFGEHQLEATALATTIGLTLALGFAAVAVRGATGGFVPLRTLARVLLALGLAAGVGSMMPPYGRWFTPVGACVVAVVYVVALALTRELTRADAHALRGLRE